MVGSLRLGTGRWVAGDLASTVHCLQPERSQETRAKVDAAFASRKTMV